MATYVLTVAGTVRNPKSGWRINRTTNNRDTMSFAVDGIRPALDDLVIMTENGTRCFAGFVDRPTESGIGGEPIASYQADISASDFNSLADGRFVTEVIPAGNLKAALTQIVSYAEGVTLDVSQVNGPSFPEITIQAVKMKAVLDDFTQRSGGYLWEMDYNKVLRMYTPGSIAAPFNITEANVSTKTFGDFTVEPSRKGYANRVWVRNESATIITYAENVTEQARPRGIVESVYIAPETSTLADLDAIAAALIITSVIEYKEVRYTTFEIGVRPSQTQTITLARRNISGTFLIVEANTFALDPLVIATEVVAREGTTFQSGWLQQWQTLLQGTGAIITGVFPSGGSGGGGSSPTPSTGRVYPIAPSGQFEVQSPTPTGVNASGGAIGKGSMQAQIDTDVIGAASIMVKVRMKAKSAGVSVYARLYDVEATAYCPGTSGTVTSQTFVSAAPWSATLTLNSPGHHYELHLFPSVANEGVSATGFLES